MMRERRAIGVAPLIAIALAILACADKPGAKQAPLGAAKPMPPLNSVNLAVTTAYSYMGYDFATGDANHFASLYADAAIFAATGIGSGSGRAAIARMVTNEGKPLHVKNLLRLTRGQAIDLSARTVRDSGRYELVGQTGRRDSNLDPKGQYWTLWRYTEGGVWEILADTLIGDGKTRKDLVQAPPSGT